MKKLFIIFLLCFKSYGQSLNGLSGLIHVPSARIIEDSKLHIGAAYIPESYFYRYGINKNPGLNTYVTFGFLPYLEVMFRYTHELNLKVNTETLYFPDRMFSFKLRILNERKLMPAIAFGAHDYGSVIARTCLDCTNYSATYFVASKFIKNKFGVFDLNLGYAFDIVDPIYGFFKLESKDFKDLFGGLTFESNHLKNIFFILEYDSKFINSGIKISLPNKFNFLIGLRNQSKLTASINIIL